MLSEESAPPGHMIIKSPGKEHFEQNQVFIVKERDFEELTQSILQKSGI